MGLTTSEKAELDTYQLKHVAQTLYVQWRDNSPLRGGPVKWEIFKKDFLNRFFPRKKRQAKVEDFIKLLQGHMSVPDYSLKFTKLSKHAPSLVFDPRDEMINFMTGCRMT